VVRLDAADRHERVAALRERVGDEVLELADLVAAERDAGVAVLALGPDLDRAAQRALRRGSGWIGDGPNSSGTRGKSSRDATLQLLTIAFSDGSGVEPAGAECIAIAFVDEQEGAALQGIVDAANGGSALGPLGRDLDRYAEQCGVDLDEAVAAATAGQAYGDDPVLDGLWDACASGDGEACDDLYFDSASGSEYERFGLTCGDRFAAAEAPDLCADAI
jgi:hypothetical protein